jgi:antitoxin HicB
MADGMKRAQASTEGEKAMTCTYTVFLRKEPEGSYTVIVPALPGCLTYGDTIPEALRMAEEAISCHVESLVLQGEPVPQEGPVLSLETSELTEGFVFRVSASIDTKEPARA